METTIFTIRKKEKIKIKIMFDFFLKYIILILFMAAGFFIANNIGLCALGSIGFPVYHEHKAISPFYNFEGNKMLCECGCGKEVKKGNRFIHGHNRRNKKQTEKTKLEISISRKKRKERLGFLNSKETRKKSSESHKGYRHLETTKRKMSESHKGRPHSEESKREMSNSHINYMLKNKDRFKDTSIEIAIEKELKKNNISYKKQVHIKNVGIVDFFIPEANLIVECDGDYWHNLSDMKKRDLNKDFASQFLGYKTLRFWEHEINKSPEKCMKKILKEIL